MIIPEFIINVSSQQLRGQLNTHNTADTGNYITDKQHRQITDEHWWKI
jgi:hypothetical protein